MPETRAVGDRRVAPGRGLDIPPAPRGWERAKWLGPGFLWMVSAAGSGELLFTPRIGARYGYALLWALLAAVALKWFINREIGRYAVTTGAPVLEGFATLPGPKNWAVWLIVVPQLVVAATSIAGFAAASASAIVVALPGPLWLWAVACVTASSALVVVGKYRRVEQAARVFAVALALAAFAAAISVSPSAAEMGRGLIPSMPDGVDYAEVLPWLGYMLSGAAGMMWYSYWITAKGYGVAGARHTWATKRHIGPVDRRALGEHEVDALRGWLGQMTFDTTVAVVGALLVTLAFLVLGVELLGPTGLLPEDEEMASVLGNLLSGVWGRFGFWMMITGVFIGFFDTLLSDQDGFGRLFANGAGVLSRRLRANARWGDPERLRKLFVVAWVTVVPMLIFFAYRDPVALLMVSGGIEAAHIPIVTFLVLYLNRRRLPPTLAPSPLAFGATAAAGLFFAAFAVFFLVSRVG